MSVPQLQRLAQDAAHRPPHEIEQFLNNLPSVHVKQIKQHLRFNKARQEVQSHQNKSEMEAIITKYQEIDAVRGMNDNDRLNYKEGMQRALNTEQIKLGDKYADELMKIYNAYEASLEKPNEEDHMSIEDYMRTANMLRDEGNAKQFEAKLLEEYAKKRIRDASKGGDSA